MMGLSSKNAPALDLPARFMVLSILSFAIAILLSPWSFPLLQGGFGDFSLLALVHLFTLGFIGSMIFGASFQLVPVAVGAPLTSVRAGRIAFWFYAAGLILFLTGLLQSWLPGLSIGGTLLGAAFLLYIGVIVTTVLKAPHKDVVAWHLLIGTIASGVGMSLGVLLAFNKSSGVLGSHLLSVLGAHITVMLAGWVGLTLTGVAYRLIGMFTLAERHLIKWLAWAELGLVAGGVILLVLRLLLDLPAVVGQVGAAGILGGFICFVLQMRRLYLRRMRKNFDIHVPFALFAGGAAIVGAASLLFGLIRHEPANDPLWVATIFMAIGGVAGTAIQGFFYKISTFLVWLKRYAPVAGTQKVPKLEELYSKQLALVGFWIWAAGILTGWVAILLDIGMMPLVGLVLIGGVGCFVVNVIRIARHWTHGGWLMPGGLDLRLHAKRPVQG